jgi:hypothetical protein
MTTATLPLQKSSKLPIMAAALLGGGGAVAAAITIGLSKVIIAGILIAIGTALVFTQTEVAIVYALVYVSIQGDVRRMCAVAGETGGSDPLLLVAPAMVFLLLLKGMADGIVKNDTRVSKLIVVLMLIMGLEVFNPLQGGIMVGATGILFYMVPLGWYWVGKSFSNAAMTRLIVFSVLVPVAVAAAALGLYQTFVGLLPYEARWASIKIVQEKTYSALMVGSQIRAFGFSCSSAEYCTLMSIGAVVLIATLLTLRPRRATIFVLPLLIAIFLASARGPIVSLMLATAAMFGATGRNVYTGLLRLLVIPLLGVPLLLSGLVHLKDVEMSERVQVLVDHQKEGFLHMGESTASGHVETAFGGVKLGFSNPLGHGLGATTVASKAAGVGSTEMDISDMFVDLGVGALVYVVLIFVALMRVFTHFRTVRTFTSLAILGILMASLAQWINGGMYSICAFICFLLGCVDQQQHDLESAPQKSSRTRPSYRRAPLAPAKSVPVMAQGRNAD